MPIVVCTNFVYIYSYVYVRSKDGNVLIEYFYKQDKSNIINFTDNLGFIRVWWNLFPQDVKYYRDLCYGVRIKVKTQADLINTQSRDKANVWPSLRNTVNIFPFLDLDPIKAVLFGDI